ncbi:hypothetical protein BOQ62_00310 [Chryseobacterium sp. CH21]|uniref:DUF1097 domain-containing protein n=1 Tax=Chryseobacterium sp. CH21 TaxID=713556 RepID=UPI00100B5CEE|nr:DUF1097 domain-containing protein [Chryseobacterium sp. CH21]RXM41431.1 hypothetical protein BOQ62_00310 [Chryseobacterium sp. CH21]
MKKTMAHSLLVGLISGLVFVFCGILGITTWIVFFSWANYFLHQSNLKKAMKMFLAFSIGIVLALLSTIIMKNTGNDLYMNGLIIFVVGTLLVFLECFENWSEMVPATFLGTVVFFASGVSHKTIISELLFPLFIGVIVGFITIVTRNNLAKILDKPKNN